MGPLIQSVLSCSVMSDSLWLQGLQPARLLCPWGFSRQEYWKGLPCPPPGKLPDPGVEPGSPAFPADSSPVELSGERYLSQVLKIALQWTVWLDGIPNSGNTWPWETEMWQEWLYHSIWPESGLNYGMERGVAVEVDKIHILKGILCHSKWFSLGTKGNSGPRTILSKDMAWSDKHILAFHSLIFSLLFIMHLDTQ